MLLNITNADEAPIAAPAISGVENPAAASGIAATLYPNAHGKMV